MPRFKTGEDIRRLVRAGKLIYKVDPRSPHLPRIIYELRKIDPEIRSEVLKSEGMDENHELNKWASTSHPEILPGFPKENPEKVLNGIQDKLGRIMERLDDEIKNRKSKIFGHEVNIEKILQDSVELRGSESAILASINRLIDGKISDVEIRPKKNLDSIKRINERVGRIKELLNEINEIESAKNRIARIKSYFDGLVGNSKDAIENRYYEMKRINRGKGHYGKYIEMNDRLVDIVFEPWERVKKEINKLEELTNRIKQGPEKPELDDVKNYILASDELAGLKGFNSLPEDLIVTAHNLMMNSGLYKDENAIKELERLTGKLRNEKTRELVKNMIKSYRG